MEEVEAMLAWYVVDEFGFVFDGAFSTFEEAEKSRKAAENDKDAKEWNLKYTVELREY